MNFKTTLALLAAVIVIGVFIFVTASNSPTENQTIGTDPKTAEKAVLSLKVDEVTSVKITPRTGDPITLVKTGTGWRLSSPVNGAAQAYAVQDLVNALVTMKSTSTLKLDAAQLDQTGLKTPEYTVVLTHAERSITTVQVGKRVIAGNITFVRVNQDQVAQVVPADVYDALALDASKYRDMTLIQQSTADVNHLILDVAGKPRIELTRDNGKWQVIAPEKMPADEQRVQSLIGSITYLRATAFPDPKVVELARSLNLLNPRITAWYSTVADDKSATSPASSPATQPVVTTPPSTGPSTVAATQQALPSGGTRLVFGDYDGPKRQNVYATSSSWEGVATIGAGTFSALNIDPLELRDRNLADIDPAMVQSVRITRTIQSTTQPTDQPINRPYPARDVAIERYHEPAPGPLGPVLPTSQPASGPSTTQATTQAVTEPAIAPEPPTWIFAGTDASGDMKVSPARMDRLLASLHPLQVQRFLTEVPTIEVGAEILTIRVEYGQQASLQSLQYELIKNGSSYFGRYNGLWFDISGKMFDEVAGDFVRTDSSEIPQSRGLPAGMPDFSEFNK